MDISSSKPCCYLLSLTLLFFSCFGNNLSMYTNTSNLHDLVYRHCANQYLSTDPAGSLPQILSSLFDELVEQSLQSKFYETSVGDDYIAVSGLFQCRNDLSRNQCFNCVNKLPEMSNTFCGRQDCSGPDPPSGCYLHYKADGSQVSRLELQHKTCSESKAVNSGFEEVRDGAFAAVVSGVVEGNGFCDTSYESMHVMAQCQGNLEGCDSGECVTNAVQIAQDECGESISGEVYLDSCFMSYNYDGINEIPSNSNQGFGKGPAGNSSSGRGLAIVVGAVAVLLVFFFFYMCRSSRKKSGDL